MDGNRVQIFFGLGTWTPIIFLALLPTTIFTSTTEDGCNEDGRSRMSRAMRYPCRCNEGDCSCCTGSILSNFNINVQNRACVNITYYPEDFEFYVRMVMNNEVIFERRMSGKNPRPLCASIPYVSAVKMCVVFSNVYIIGRNLHMCVSIDGKFRENTIYSYSFDCIRVGTSGVALLSPEEGGGLGPPKPITENSTNVEDYDTVVASEGDDIQIAK